MNNGIFEIEWGALENWYVSIIVVLLVLFLMYRLVRSLRLFSVLAPTKSAKLFLQHCSKGRTLIKLLLLSIASVGIFVALLRPMWNKREEIVEQEGRDLFVALDISRSMLATDCEPNRLTAAKNKIKKLLPLLSCERVGLILFAGSGVVQCPLTKDYAAFTMFLDAIDADTVSAGTTALDQAILKAMESFGQMKDKKNKLLVIFTDGEDFSSDLAAIKRQAISQGLHIFTIGVGTVAGAPIPLYNAYGKQEGHQLDDKGNVVITHLNEGILRSVAQDSGSVYIALTHDDTDINSLVSQVTAFEKEKLEDKKVALYEEQYHYFLLISFVSLLLEWIL